MREHDLAPGILPFAALLHVVLHHGPVDVGHELEESIGVVGKASDGYLAVGEKLCLEVEYCFGLWGNACASACITVVGIVAVAVSLPLAMSFFPTRKVY